MGNNGVLGNGGDLVERGIPVGGVGWSWIICVRIFLGKPNDYLSVSLSLFSFSFSFFYRSAMITK